MKSFTQNDLTSMESRYRAQLINSLSGFKSANLIGTIDNQGQTNVAIFSSVFHLGASPALTGFIIRPHSVDRHTLENIEQTQSYTINQVGQKFWPAAHQTSARYAKNECEFEQTGLSKTFIDGIKAPFVAESLLKYALTLKEIVPITLNNTLMVIGEITNILCEDSAITDDGYIDIESLGTVAISGLDSYHESQRLSRLSYAKPHQLPVHF
ncbi:flavin reductase family protein [Colwellia sp. RSH04]|uniref:flavin reductase family protein n=1 Tax=Colwellia sp. RSH04 TaxID=2305464 RepID=UPI000E584569|nr:flavin reductase [Colwellia sp. RSH04]RHW77884.1 flavin oxidoreductase [Colwellia sp. RSH04]